MPRVTVKKQEYKLKDFSKWLKGQLAMNGFNQSDLAEWLRISQQAVSYKLKNNSFDLQEIITIFKQLGTTKEEVGNLLIY